MYPITSCLILTTTKNTSELLKCFHHTARTPHTYTYFEHTHKRTHTHTHTHTHTDTHTHTHTHTHTYPHAHTYPHTHCLSPNAVTCLEFVYLGVCVCVRRGGGER